MVRATAGLAAGDCGEPAVYLRNGLAVQPDAAGAATRSGQVTTLPIARIRMATTGRRPVEKRPGRGRKAPKRPAATAGPAPWLTDYSATTLGLCPAQ